MMNREIQEHLLAELSRPGLSWQTGPSHDTQAKATLRWLPIVNLAVPRIELGLSSDAYWVRIAPQSVSEFRPDMLPVFLLPVLEVPFVEAQRLFREALQTRGLSKDFLAVFPFEQVATTGLESDSEHWASLALEWAETMPSSQQLQDALQTLVRHGPTQELRHAAQKLLARHRKSLTEGNQQL